MNSRCKGRNWPHHQIHPTKQQAPFAFLKMIKIFPNCSTTQNNAPSSTQLTPTIGGMDDLFSEQESDRSSASQDQEALVEEFHSERIVIPSLAPLPSKEFVLLKLPSFCFIQPELFDPLNYSEHKDIFPNVQLNESQESRQFKAYNVIRNSLMEGQRSNTKIVQWSDGSFSLKIGKEYFEMNQIPTLDSKTIIFHQHTATGDAGQSVLESVGAPSKRFQVRPYNTSSAAHKRYSKAVLARHAKESKIKIAFTTNDPEKQKIALEKAEQERIRMQRRLDAKRRNAQRASAMERTKLTRAYLEDDYAEEEGDGEEEGEEDEIYNEEVENETNVYSAERDSSLMAAKNDDAQAATEEESDDADDGLLSSRFKSIHK